MARRILLSALLILLVSTTPSICFESCAFDDDASGCPHAQFAIAVDVPDAVPPLDVRRATSPVASSFTTPIVSDVFHVPLLG